MTGIAESTEPFSRGESLATKMRTSVPFVAGAILTGLILLLLLLGPIWLQSTTFQDPNALLSGPSAQHWLGTDQLGRDVLSRLVSAGRTDLRIAILALLFPAALGIAVGTLAGYLG